MKSLDPQLLRYARLARAYMVLLVAAGMAITILAVVQCYATAAAFARLVSRGGSSADLGLPLGLIAGAPTGRALVGYAQRATGHRTTLRIIAQLCGRVLDSVADRGQYWLADGKIGLTVTLATESLDALEPYFVGFLPQLVLTCLVTLATFTAVVRLDWISVTAILICLPLIPILMVLVGKMTQVYSNEHLRATQCLGSQLLNLLVGLSTLKGPGHGSVPRKRVKDLSDSHTCTTMKTLHVAFLSGAVLEFPATISTTLVVIEVGLRIVGDDLNLFSGLVIIMLTPEYFKPLREVGVQLHAPADSIAAAGSVFDILENGGETEASRKAEAPGKTASDLPCPDLVVLPVVSDWLGAASPGHATVTPSDPAVSIEPDEVTVFRGRPDAGKSTAATVILGLVSPTSGSARIGHMLIEHALRESL